MVNFLRTEREKNGDKFEKRISPEKGNMWKERDNQLNSGDGNLKLTEQESYGKSELDTLEGLDMQQEVNDETQRESEHLESRDKSFLDASKKKSILLFKNA